MTGPSRPGQDMALDTRKAIADMDPLDMAYGGHVTRIERAAHLAQLADQRLGHLGTQGMSETVPGAGRLVIGLPPEGAQRLVADQIGRASCRERVCQYVYITVVAPPLPKQ